MFGRSRRSPPPPADAPGSGAAAVAAFIDLELKSEDARKASIETRGVAVITTSGVLVTLLFGLVAVVTKASDYSVPALGLGVVVAALAFFVGAATLALLANSIKTYERVKVQDIRNTVESESGTITTSQAQSRIARANLKVLESARANNNMKARRLKWAFLCEVMAVVLLALAVGVVAIEELAQIVRR